MRPWAAAVVALAATGVALRVWVLTGDMALLDADEAVVGLQALRAGHGDPATFFLGQSYGGTLESMVAAVPVRVFGGETMALRAAAGAISLVSVALLFFLARRVLDEKRAAPLAAALLFAWPPVYVWFGLRTMGFYASSLALGLGLCLVLAVLADDQRWRWYAVLGLVVGVAWWQSPYVVYFAVPGLAWLAARKRWRAIVRLPAAIPTAIVGAAPWLFANVGHGFPSFDSTVYGGYAGTYFGKVAYVFHTGLPVALGLKLPFAPYWSKGWIGQATYLVLLAALGVAIGVGLWRRRLYAFGLVAFPFLFALNPVGPTAAHGRYFLFLSPWLALLAADVVGRSRARLAVVAVAVIATTGLGITALDAIGWRAAFRPSTEEVATALRADGIEHAFADYFLAYKLAFESDDDVLVAPFGAVRDKGDDRRVRAADRAAYVFTAGDPAIVAVREGLVRLDIGATEQEVGDFVIIVPDEPVLPEELADVSLGF